MDVVEVTRKEDFDDCTYTTATPVPYYNPATNPSNLQGIKTEHQIEGFVVGSIGPYKNRYFISKDQEQCKEGLKVNLNWFIADGK